MSESAPPTSPATAAPTPRFPRDDQRVALIVIPTVARPKTLLPAFTRLLAHLDGLPVHICVAINAVDQADGDESQRQVVKIWESFAEDASLPPGSLLTVYRHPGPCGFGGALNRGISVAANGNGTFDEEWPEGVNCLYGDDGEPEGNVIAGLPPLIIFYNDDLEAADGWLAEMVAAHTATDISDIIEPTRPDRARPRHPVALYGKIGIVGPVTNLAAGQQCLRDQEVKAWRKMGTDRFSAAWRDHHASELTTADFLSGFCLGITRECLEALWGANPDRDGTHLFDEASFPIAGFEDNDLCVRAAEAGFRAAIAAGSFVGHVGHQTFDALFPDHQRGMRNRLSYYRKWAPWTASRARDLVAALRVKIEVPHDLRLLRHTLGRLGMLVDKVAILFTNDPSEAMDHAEYAVDLQGGAIPEADLVFLKALRKNQTPDRRRRRDEATTIWIQGCVEAGSKLAERARPKVYAAFWPQDRPMNERDERNAVITMAERAGASWIWSIDHDEVVEPRVTRAHIDRWMTHPDPLANCLDQGFYTTWESVNHYRTDAPWGDSGAMTGGMRGWRLWRVNPAAPGRILAGTGNGLHCGNSPTGDAMTKRHAAIRIIHHGYLRTEDRHRKKARYDRQDPNPDPMLVGGANYNHLVDEQDMILSRFQPRTGIGLHMLVHAGEDPNGAMNVLDQMHALVDAAVLVWTSDPGDPARALYAEVAALFGAELIDQHIDSETGGLADARNAGIDRLAALEEERHLGLGWSLFLDPDEHLPGEAYVALRRMADERNGWGWLFTYHNPHGDGTSSQSESVRMARLRPNMRMDGRVHEGFGLAIKALKAEGFGDILRTAPFVAVNAGLAVSPEQLQAKYDRYFKWALSAIAAGEARSVDWTTVGLYFANEGLWKAPELCYAKATAMDGESFLAPRELGMHYLRMARGPLALGASRLPGHPQRDHLERMVKMIDELAPSVAGMGLVGKPGRQVWTEAKAERLIEAVENAPQMEAELAWVGPSEDVDDNGTPSPEPFPVNQTMLPFAAAPTPSGQVEPPRDPQVDPKVGDVITIWITGRLEERRARVLEVNGDDLVLRVLGEDGELDPTWPTLRFGDYILVPSRDTVQEDDGEPE